MKQSVFDCERRGFTDEVTNSAKVAITFRLARGYLPSRVTVIIIIIIITTTIFIVLSSTAPAICESSLWFIWAKVGQHQVAANSQAKLQT